MRPGDRQGEGDRASPEDLAVRNPLAVWSAERGAEPRSQRVYLPGEPPGASSGSVDAAIRKDWAPEAPIETRFDLNRRQFYLDTLRQKAGPNASQAKRAAFEETQRRLNAARARLDDNDCAADREVLEIFRIGAVPVDVIAGGLNIASGEAELRDYLAVAVTIPLSGTIGKIGKVGSRALEPTAREVVQLGGAFHAFRKLRGYIRSKFGNIYDAAIEQMLEYTRKAGF